MGGLTTFGLILMLAAMVFAKNKTLEQRLRDNPDLSEVDFIFTFFKNFIAMLAEISSFI